MLLDWPLLLSLVLSLALMLIVAVWQGLCTPRSVLSTGVLDPAVAASSSARAKLIRNKLFGW